MSGYKGWTCFLWFNNHQDLELHWRNQEQAQGMGPLLLESGNTKQQHGTLFYQELTSSWIFSHSLCTFVYVVITNGTSKLHYACIPDPCPNQDVQLVDLSDLEHKVEDQEPWNKPSELHVLLKQQGVVYYVLDKSYIIYIRRKFIKRLVFVWVVQLESLCMLRRNIAEIFIPWVVLLVFIWL